LVIQNILYKYGNWHLHFLDASTPFPSSLAFVPESIKKGSRI
jgi:hypothetical protein